MSASKKPRPEKDEELIASATRFLQAYAASATVKDAVGALINSVFEQGNASIQYLAPNYLEVLAPQLRYCR